MTPNKSGLWLNMLGVDNLSDCDFAVVIDHKDKAQEIPEEKIIYIGAHPTSCDGYQCFDDKKCFAKLDSRDTLGMLEWWLRYSYDDLVSLKPMKKTKGLCTILSNQRHYDYHRKRIEFINEYCRKYPKTIEVYGRIQCRQGEEEILRHYKGPCGVPDNNPYYMKLYWYGKEEVLEQHRYVLEFDMGESPQQGICKPYCSERFADDILLWSMPIYYGGTEIDRFFPKDSFIYLDIFKDDPKKIYDIINSDIREKNLDAIAECRNLILNKYSLWPRIYEVIHGTSKI
jgi:hypothetical protein